MANSSLTLTSLDFNTLKQNFVSYLQSNSAFKDFNFQGSNINTLLDLMSYNSYLNAFYLNMVASEMFMDSAQKLNSVVSHAKELNYVPRSAKSSEATVSFTINTSGISNPFVIPKGTQFSGTNSNGTFTYTTDTAHTYVSASNIYNVANLTIYEGSYFNDSFVIDYANPVQSFILSNQNIDTDSLVVTVYENNGATNTVFTAVENLFNLNSNSNVYFLQGAQNGLYEIVFGDGLFGRIPYNGSIVNASYRVTSGTDGDGISSFTLLQNLSEYNGGGIGSVVASLATATTPSAGSSNAQSIESIRFEAPRYFATQQRAVSSDDYSSLVLSNFNTIEAVNVYGGEQLNPKQYGTVAVCLKPAGGTIAPDYLKNEIVNYLTNYIALPNKVVITDPSYIYCAVNTNIQYSANSTTLSVSELNTLTSTSIFNYSANNLGVFGANFRYSKFGAAIDATDPSFLSNETEIQIIKRISPLLNYPTTYTLYFNNAAYQYTSNSLIGYTQTNPFYEDPVITSSSFTYIDSSTNITYDNCYIRDDNFGNLVVYTDINNQFVILNSALGTVDYANGIVSINNLLTSSYGNYISIYMKPEVNDITVSRENILLIDLNDVSITLTAA
jgi:hypothetical protein